MKKNLVTVFLVIFTLSIFTQKVFASGGMMHMYVAHESIRKLSDLELRKLLWENLDAYLVGAYYPDAGYIRGDFGEVSHWDPFIYKFTDYIQEQYPNYVNDNPRLVAFLMGCAAHRVSDEISHHKFYPIMAKQDFSNNGKKAHNYGDVGIDLLLNIDRNQWQIYPLNWWVPLKDLLNVYERMHVNVKKADLLFDVTVLSMAGYGERLISLPAYPYLWLRMPWTARNYYNWPEGGTLMVTEQVAQYQMKIWRRLHNEKVSIPDEQPPRPKDYDEKTFAHQFAEAAYTSGALSVTATENSDGSVSLTQPLVQKLAAFNQLLSKFLSLFTS